MSEFAIQDLYAEAYSYCYGCGRLNDHGLQIKSYWEEKVAVCRFTPREYHIAIPGYVYGGLIASLIDCHSIGTAAAGAPRALSSPGGQAIERYVTGSLHVDYLHPTPLGTILEVRAWIEESGGRKTLVRSTLSALGRVTAQGEVVAIRLPDDMKMPPGGTTSA